ncbi:DUF397 domain-containing protein [Streptomyces iconiensis]|uniref:DUF397 domain-containing protein n=1 Tax=Streptomyces iconiensis TaxID=1384038 RepID=A0ABT6ZZ40_9ACTN|nr:DUF397 domain-containing protein [Streptomyces iconiensis]MDJ1134127.1 DUF397 domain-containing protein [Streptomyces iconiensis]
MSEQYPGHMWRKSSYSGSNQGECLEVADGFANIPVRDSKNPGGPVITIGTEAFAAFVGAIRDGAI